MPLIVASLACGLIFGTGLLISGMTEPDKVLGFLDIFGAWDATLAFVMAGAVAVTAAGFAWARRRGAPVLAATPLWPSRNDIDAPLVQGAVLFGIGCGALLGYMSPDAGAAMRPLGDGFIKLIRMLIAPIVFCTVVVGIAQMGALKELGRIGLRALVYFEVVSSLALVIGLIVVTLVEPGAGVNADRASLDVSAVTSYTAAAKALTATDFILNIIPTTFVDAFGKGEILQVLLLSVLFGLALLQIGHRASALVGLIDQASQGLFQVVGMIMRLAPIGAPASPRLF